MSISPNIPGGGTRQQRAAQLRATAEAQQSPASEDAVNDPAPQAAQPQSQPVGQGDYAVKRGDCLASIAKQTGHFWETIWNDPANAELKRVRKNPNVLLVGDRLTIPDCRPKQEPGATEARHRFVRRGEPSLLRLKLLDNDQPLANLPYRLMVDGHECAGTTDADGKVETEIAGTARRAELYVGTGDEERYYELQLGELPPVETPEGLMARLRNLGYECDEAGRELGPLTEEALRMFQRQRGLSETGQPDEDTRNRLRDAHEEGWTPPSASNQAQAPSGAVWESEEIADDDPAAQWGADVEAVAAEEIAADTTDGRSAAPAGASGEGA